MSSPLFAGASPPEFRQIRVFLSSTFRDFMEERDLLVKQVFPSLRRLAQERGVEVVDVDLRWGITEEESQQGKVIGICLAEIDRCRPFFIGMLGERYGWTPQPGDYPPELLEQEQLGWIRDHQGGASVTELEILHGVLNDPKMAGRAFFYFRDPAWSQAQSEPGFVCDTPEEEAKLAALKERIRTSGFPVAETLPDPKAIADQIEADLLSLIEERYPDLDQADALEKEARKHASYRQSRLGVYLGQEYVDQVEAFVSSGQQKILITGESGSGKSALIANWMHQHELEHPGDVVYTHHLGCSNDASAIRPLLGRMLDTASALLLDHALISDSIDVPEDWWELTAKVAETLQCLGRWCRKTGNRWIWVLDGLDRLAPEDQQALPWLPLLIPQGVSVVISALNCPARAIVQERQFQLLEIGPLKREEQEQLIQRYLQRYTKQLDGGLRQLIAGHPQAGSPLFLRVLLEELRQCGRYETLAEQLTGYLQATSVAELYGLVLQQLEIDGNGAACTAALTALWASRAGLPEAELLAITQLTPLQWAPIDLALQEALGRSGNRLVFGHDFLRQAVEMRYLRSEESRRSAHCAIADWFGAQKEWEGRKAEELPWQLGQAQRFIELRGLLLDQEALPSLCSERSNRELLGYWRAARQPDDPEFDALIAVDVEREIEALADDPELLAWFVDQLGDLLSDAGLEGDLLVRLRTLSLDIEEELAQQDNEPYSLLWSMRSLAALLRRRGDFQQAEALYQRCQSTAEHHFGVLSQEAQVSIDDLAGLYRDAASFSKAESLYRQVLQQSHRCFGYRHPSTLDTVSNLARLYADLGDYSRAERLHASCLREGSLLLGTDHRSTLLSLGNLASVHHQRGDFRQAEDLYRRCLQASEQVLGLDDPSTLSAAGNLALLYSQMGEYEQARSLHQRCLSVREDQLGPNHPEVLRTRLNFAGLLHDTGEHEQALELMEACVNGYGQLLGHGHPDTLVAAGNLAMLYGDLDRLDEAEALYLRCLETRVAVLGSEHPDTLSSLHNLGVLRLEQGRFAEAADLLGRCLDAFQRTLGPGHPDTLTVICQLAAVAQEQADDHGAEELFRRALAGRKLALGNAHPATLAVMGRFADFLSNQGRLEEAINLRRQELTALVERNGED